MRIVWSIACWLLLIFVCIYITQFALYYKNEGWRPTKSIVFPQFREPPKNWTDAWQCATFRFRMDADMVLEVGMQTRYPKTLSILIRCIGTHIMVQTSMILGRNMLRCIPGRLVIHIAQSLTALIVKHLLQGSLSLTNLYFALFVGQLRTQVMWDDKIETYWRCLFSVPIIQTIW